MKGRMRSQAGLTLADVVISLLVVGLLTSVVTGVLMGARNGWIVGSARLEGNAQLRRAVDWMSRELAQSAPAQVSAPPADGVWAGGITFRIPEDLDGDGTVLDGQGTIAEWSETITYGLGSGNTCVRTLGGGGSSVLAHHATALQFRRTAAAPDVVEIRVTTATALTGGASAPETVEIRVRLRNP